MDSTIKEAHINEEEYRRNIVSWYKEYVNLTGLTLVSSEIQELNAQLGLYYLYSDYQNNNVVFKVLDEQLFFLAKIKFGI